MVSGTGSARRAQNRAKNNFVPAIRHLFTTPHLNRVSNLEPTHSSPHLNHFLKAKPGQHLDCLKLQGESAIGKYGRANIDWPESGPLESTTPAAWRGGGGGAVIVLLVGVSVPPSCGGNRAEVARAVGGVSLTDFSLVCGRMIVQMTPSSGTNCPFSRTRDRSATPQPRFACVHPC